MEKVRIFGLGGLDEMGKNTYVIEINDDIFVFDCGVKYAEGFMYGIDYIIPDYEYLIKNKKRIKGIFITHGHYENMGAAADLARIIPGIKFYATHYTKFVLMDLGVKEENIVEVKPNKKINFGKVSIFPMPVSHSVPGAVMYCVNTKHGAICYTGDFIIDPLMKDAYDMDLGKIAYVGKQGVLCLLSESVFSEHAGHTSPTHRLASFFADAINKCDGRIFFSVLPTHLYTIQDILEGAKNSHRKVVIMGKKLQNFIRFAHEHQYLNYSEDLIGDLTNINDSNSILLICDDKSNAYAAINKIVNGYDKFIKLREGDSFVFAEPRYDANEKVLVKLENDLAMAGCKIVSLPKNNVDTFYHMRNIDTKKTLTLSQGIQLIEASKTTPIYMQVIFAFCMGLRRSEIIGVKYSDIDYVNRTLKIQRQLGRIANTKKEDFKKKTYTKQEIDLKTDSSYRTIPIPDYVFNAILEQRKIYEKNQKRRKKEFQDLGYICCSSYGRPRSKDFHWQHFKKLLQDTGLPDIRWHDLRSSFCTILLKNNFSPKAVSK